MHLYKNLREEKNPNCKTMAGNNFSEIKKTYEFVIKLIEKISAKRENQLLLDRCKSMKLYLPSLEEADSWEFRSDLYNLIDELKFIIQAEIRFFLFPMPDIKQETYELGKKYMNNFLEWIKPEDNYSVEEILGILKDEFHLLDEAKNLLDKAELNKNN